MNIFTGFIFTILYLLIASHIKVIACWKYNKNETIEFLSFQKAAIFH